LFCHCVVFFFQAEDGIRAFHVTGVQTCALPILVYVDSAITDAGDGSSWQEALKHLSTATEATKNQRDIHEIHVAKGTYYPTGDQAGTDRFRYFGIARPGIKLYGGYPNGGGIRDHQAYVTTLSGDIGIPKNNTDNSYHVIILTGEATATDSLVIDGFTITGGNANDSEPVPPLAASNLGIANNVGGGMITV